MRHKTNMRRRITPNRKIIILCTIFLLHECDVLFFDNKTSSNQNDQQTYPEGCQGYESGDTFPCPCSTGMIHMRNDRTNGRKTKVFNQCRYGIQNGAYHGIDHVDIRSGEGVDMGMAVYSTRLNLCGGNEQECYCTCFNRGAVNGASGFKTSISAEDHDADYGDRQRHGDIGGRKGYVTDCLGLCGPHCEQGDGNGVRYASILIHDICQSTRTIF